MDKYGSEPAPKRRKVDATLRGTSTALDQASFEGNSVTLSSLSRSITPPTVTPRATTDLLGGIGLQDAIRPSEVEPPLSAIHHNRTVIPSPIHLTHIRDASPRDNVDAVKLADILGDPLISECWQFNYLFDVDFLMAAFDGDVRNLIKVNIVHGSTDVKSSNRAGIEEGVGKWKNVRAFVAKMPYPFGTHHSKMMVLFRHDDTTQIIIHTANMIPQDWKNMTQAVWSSPSLPLLKPTADRESSQSVTPAIGSGTRFKVDLLRYLDAYGTALGPLVRRLSKYDFSSIRAALVASTPSYQPAPTSVTVKHTAWGWPGLKQILSSIPCTASTEDRPRVVVQVSSVGSLGSTDKWLMNFQDVLACKAQTEPPVSIGGRTLLQSSRSVPTLKIIFPTPDEIRRSLDGYRSGGSIHMKTTSNAQLAQLRCLRPYLCRWSEKIHSAMADPLETSKPVVREAGRRRAAPHIKTYIRFSGAAMDTIDWAMVTSANISTQAWGSLPTAKGDVRICSWEIGVVVWPALFASESSSGRCKMVPTFRTDTPTGDVTEIELDTTVGLRMPYDLPLVPYEAGDVPWCATADYSAPDWKGVVWQGHE